MLESLSLDLPIGRPLINPDGENGDLNWWFFNKGVVIDVIGQYVIPQQLAYKLNQWTKLLSNLSRYRKRRPIDGVICAISVQDLWGENALSHEDIVDQSKKIQTCLWDLQNSLSMKVPVYIVLTKLDVINGYKEFIQSLPVDKRDQILGWSAPFPVGTAYSPKWMDEVFTHFQAMLSALYAEICADAVHENSGLELIFKVELQKIQSNLASYINNMFHESAYHDSFFLRGIYLCGDGADHTAVGQNMRKENFWIPPKATGYAVDHPFAQQDGRKIDFINELFEKKIFAEHAVAKPIRRILVTTNKMVLSFQSLMACFLMIWCVGLFFAVEPLNKINQTLTPLLKESNDTIYNMLYKNFDITNDTDVEYLNSQTVKIIQLMEASYAKSTFFIFIPASWMGKLDFVLDQALIETWNRIILYSLYGSFKKKANALFLPMDSAKDSTQQSFVNPVQSPEFASLSHYVQEVVELERVVQKFNDLDKTQNLNDLSLVIKYLYNYVTSNQFYVESQLYQHALSGAKNIDVSLQNYSSNAQVKFEALSASFQNVAFEPSKTIGDVEKMKLEFDRLKSISESNKDSASDINQSTDLIMKIAQSMISKDFKWVEEKNGLRKTAFLRDQNI